jgi:hypothetical protein
LRRSERVFRNFDRPSCVNSQRTSDRAIRVFGKLLLVPSEHEYASGRKTEIPNERAREQQQNKQVLLPVPLAGSTGSSRGSCSAPTAGSKA